MLGIDRSEAALTLAGSGGAATGWPNAARFAGPTRSPKPARWPDPASGSISSIADPPAFANAQTGRAGGVARLPQAGAARRLLTAPGGFLFIASCSHNVGAAEFADTVRRGLFDAGRAGRILRESGAGADHPVHPALPETAYLKALTLALD